MNRAFIFDMDGVLVNSEYAWVRLETQMLERVLGKTIAQKINTAPGTGIEGLWKLARAAGSEVSHEEIARGFDSIYKDVYAESPITEGLNALGETLSRLGYRIGLVTQSLHKWIDRVLPRVPFKDEFKVVLSLGEHPELRLKPEPDGFLEAFRILDAKPKYSIILEDSNIGIAAGKASGAYTIGFRGNLLPGYRQEGADAYADTMDDVVKIVRDFNKNQT